MAPAPLLKCPFVNDISCAKNSDMQERHKNTVTITSAVTAFQLSASTNSYRKVDHQYQTFMTLSYTMSVRVCNRATDLYPLVSVVQIAVGFLSATSSRRNSAGCYRWCMIVLKSHLDTFLLKHAYVQYRLSTHIEIFLFTIRDGSA